MPGHRLFFALSPPPPVRAKLVQAANALGGACTGEDLHLTLVFLGNFSEGGDAPARARAAAARVRANEFMVALDEAASFGPTWFLGSHAPLAPLLALHESLSVELARAGFALEHRDFHPHVTFRRRAGGALAPTPIAAIDWTARDFGLFDSRAAAGRYVELGRWPLLGNSAPSGTQ
jgi:2'-5' RNA ligase